MKWNDYPMDDEMYQDMCYRVARLSIEKLIDEALDEGIDVNEHNTIDDLQNALIEKIYHGWEGM